jgi:hypothetical protein
MNEQQIELPPGGHALERPILDCRVAGYDGERDLAKLLLSVESHQTKDKKRQPATTVAVYVKRDAAIRLLLDLHKMSNDLGWSLEEPIRPT